MQVAEFLTGRTVGTPSDAVDRSVCVELGDVQSQRRIVVERLGRRRRERALSAGETGRAHRGGRSEADVEMGLRFPRRARRARAAGGDGRPPVRRERNRHRVCARCEDRLHLLDVPRAGRRALGAERRTVQERVGSDALRRVLRRQPRQRVCGRRRHRTTDLDAQDGRSSGCGRHRRADVVRRPSVRARGRHRRRRAGRTAGLRVLHVPRQSRRRSTRRPAPSCGRPTASPKSRSRAARPRRACRRRGRRAAASGPRPRSIPGATRSTSRPATATPIRRSGRRTRSSRST